MIHDPVEKLARVFVSTAKGGYLDAPYIAFENLFRKIGGINKEDIFKEAVHAILYVIQEDQKSLEEPSLSPAERQVIEQMRDYLLSNKPKFIPPILKQSL